MRDHIKNKYLEFGIEVIVFVCGCDNIPNFEYYSVIFEIGDEVDGIEYNRKFDSMGSFSSNHYFANELHNIIKRDCILINNGISKRRNNILNELLK